MLNEDNVNVRLVRSTDSFLPSSGEANRIYKVKLISSVLLVRKVQLSPSVFLANAKALESGFVKYPIRRVACKTYTILAGNLDGNHEKLFTGQLSSRRVIGCVDNDALTKTLSRIRSILNVTFLYSWMETLNRSNRWNQILTTSSTSRQTQHIFRNRQRKPRLKQRYCARRLPKRLRPVRIWPQPGSCRRRTFQLGQARDLPRRSSLEQRSPTLWPLSPAPSLRTSSKSTATETASTTLAFKHEH